MWVVVHLHPFTVALRKESVDRNESKGGYEKVLERVALRKEGVDRNSMYHNTTPADMQSLSARRAWIEIGYGIFLFLTVQGGGHADIRFNFENCYSKNSRIK